MCIFFSNEKDEVYYIHDSWWTSILMFKLLMSRCCFIQKIRTFQELKDLSPEERTELLTSVGGFSAQEATDVEAVLQMIPNINLDVVCETEGEEGVQAGDIVTLRAWITLQRPNGLVAAHPHAPHFPYAKDEHYWLLLADVNFNSVWVSQRVSFTDEPAALAAASKILGGHRGR